MGRDNTARVPQLPGYSALWAAGSPIPRGNVAATEVAVQAAVQLVALENVATSGAAQREAAFGALLHAWLRPGNTGTPAPAARRPARLAAMLDRLARDVAGLPPLPPLPQPSTRFLGAGNARAERAAPRLAAQRRRLGATRAAVAAPADAPVRASLIWLEQAGCCRLVLCTGATLADMAASRASCLRPPLPTAAARLQAAVAACAAAAEETGKEGWRGTQPPAATAALPNLAAALAAEARVAAGAAAAARAAHRARLLPPLEAKCREIRAAAREKK